MKDWVVVADISMEGKRVSRRQNWEELWTVACRYLHVAARGSSEEWGRKPRMCRKGTVGRSSRANISSDCLSAIITLRRKLKISLINEHGVYVSKNHSIDQLGHKNLDNVVFNGAVYMRYDHYHQSYSSYTKFNFEATAPESACST